MPPLSDALHEAPGALGTVRNATVLLELLADGPAYQQLTDLAERSGLTVPTVHRLLRSLVLAGLVEQDPRTSRYGLGPELARLSHRYLARLPVLGALAPYLTQVRTTVGATVHVQLLVGTSIVYVDRVDGPDAGLYRAAHGVHPGLRTAGGRLLLARGDDERWKAALETDEELAAVAERDRDRWSAAGWLRAPGPVAGGPDEVAVPVLDATGTALGALVADLPVDADDAAAAATAGALTRAAAAATRTLGHG
ncbi:MAG TPA: helix-turn-helix domain-containing protein [Dermatophilaceae bacterium]|nr:helix-turn-helix domain-containing protein [Dermatophilaceae bacterium]